MMQCNVNSLARSVGWWFLFRENVKMDDMQVENDNPKFLNNEMKSRKRRIGVCRTLISNQTLDSETENQDFSPSESSDFDPDAADRFSDDSMNLVFLSDVKNHPDNKSFWKESLSEKQSSSHNTFPLATSLPKTKENNDRILCEDDTLPMTIIKDMYEAQDDSGEPDSDSENNLLDQPQANNQKKKRMWVRKNACIFCEQLVTNFTRHLLRHHKNESKVLQYLSINDPDPKIRKQRRRKITDDLRNRGNFIHNSKVIFEKEGDLIPKKGTCRLSSPSTFTTCKNCLATFKRKYFYKHFKTCSAGLLNMDKFPDSYKKRVLANHSINIIPHLSAASQEVRDHILSRLRNDEISELVKTDPLILAYGSRLMKKKKEARSRKAICSKLRDLGNLLLQLKSADPSIQKLSDLFKPQHYTTLIECVKKMCGFNEKTGFVETISIPSRLRPSVIGCIEVLYTEMIMGHESQAYKETLKKQLDDFKLLIEINWEWEISSNAEKTRKRNSMTKEMVMPNDEDIRTVTEKIHELEKSYSKQLKKDVNVLNYENLCEVTIAHIIIMDKKRAGDIAEAELCFYLNRKEEETPAKVFQLLTLEEKEANDELDIFMIPGKRTRSVPVLLTKQMRRNIDLIVASRISVGVADNNPLLFARPLTSRPFDGGKCLNKIKSMCKLTNPKMLTSTGVRHHVATMSQLHAKKNDKYTEHLAGFLGHDLAVHSSNYRLPLQVIQKAIIGSSLMEFEKSENMDLDFEKDEPNNKPKTTNSISMELVKAKCQDESNYSISHIDGQSKEIGKEIQDNDLVKQTKSREAIDVIDIIFQERRQSNDRQFLTENNETMSENDQAGKKIQENIFSKAVERIENVKIIIEEEHPCEDKSCERRQEKNTKAAQDISQFHELQKKIKANRIERNVKGQFQVEPHESKINKNERKMRSTVQNAENKYVEEKQMIIIKDREVISKPCKSSSNEEIDRSIVQPEKYKPIKKRKAQKEEKSASSSDDSQSVVQTRRRKKSHTLWSKQELTAVRTYFKDNIKNKTNPGKAKCLEVLKKAPVLSRRTWMQLNTQVNNIYKNKINC